jgi:CYTH domain-containing protein
VLTKTRLRLPPFGVDVFDGRWRGLIVAEAEFTSDDDLRAFVPPGPAVAEVSGDHRFTGGRLALASRAEIAAAAADYGLDLGPYDPGPVGPDAG